jgi:hypothetical protein
MKLFLIKSMSSVAIVEEEVVCQWDSVAGVDLENFVLAVREQCGPLNGGRARCCPVESRLSFTMAHNKCTTFVLAW